MDTRKSVYWTHVILASCFALLAILPSAQAEMDPSLFQSVEKRRVDVLRELRAKTGDDELMSFDDKSFKRFVLNPISHDYSFVLLFSSDRAQPCQPCMLFNNQLRSIRSWYERNLGAGQQPTLFFVELTPNNCQEAFKHFGLQQIPVLVYLPPREKKGMAPAFFQITMDSLTDPSVLAQWVETHSNQKIPIPTVPWKDPLLQKIVVGLIVMLVLYKLPFIIRNYDHPMIWYICFLGVFAFTLSGVVFNAIHGTAWKHVDPWGGGSTYFLPDMRAQVAAEGVIITVMHFVAVALYILLTNWVPTIQKAWLRLPLFVLMFGGLCFDILSIWKIYNTFKFQNYPFYFNVPFFLP